MTLFAVPYRGEGTPAWVLEGDRFGQAVRRPEDAPPRHQDAILCSNHFAYGCSEGGHAFGREPSFSSLWRYEAGRHTLDAWARPWDAPHRDWVTYTFDELFAH